MTMVSDGLYAYGGVPVSGGAGRLSLIWANENVFFVDGVNGSAGNPGKKPEEAVALISTAVGKASKDAVIYVRPQTTTGSAVMYYRDNITIPVTKPNMSIIGCGATHGNPNTYTGVQLKVAAAATDSHMFDVDGGGLYLENMRLFGEDMTGATASIVNVDIAGSTQRGRGLTVNACIFEECLGEASLGTTPILGSVTGGTCTYLLVENCVFYNCLSGVALIGTSGTLGRVAIRNNVFAGAPGYRGVDVYLSPGSGEYGSWVEISRNIFSDGLPTGGANNKFIFIIGTGTGIIAGNYFASTAPTGATGWGPSGTECTIPDTFFMAGNFANEVIVAGQT